MRRVLCWLGWHSRPPRPGLIAYECAHCPAFVFVDR